MDQGRALFTLDFDGVLTDWSSLDLSCLDRRAFFRPPRSVEYAPLRRGAREAAALLRCFGDVGILTARPDSHAPWMRKWLEVNAPELADSPIISVDGPKWARLEELGVSLHIDDSFEAAPARDTDHGANTVIWSSQLPSELIAIICEALSQLPRLGLAGAKGDVRSISPIRVTSPTPTVLVETASGRLKVRLFTSIDSWKRSADFHDSVRGTEAESYLPTLRGAFPMIMITDYVEGEMADSLTSNERADLIPPLARFLSCLHQIDLTDRGLLGRLPYATGYRLVSCAVDAFNICRTPDGRPLIIDIGDCHLGDPLVDLIWAEQLYCDDLKQRRSLISHYWPSDQSGPSGEAVDLALAEYYSWLHFVVIKAKRWNRGNARAWRESHEISLRRSTPPTDSELRRLASSQ
jgi:hypothetical protein